MYLFITSASYDWLSWMGVGSTRFTYSGAPVPCLFTFTTSLIFFISYVSLKSFRKPEPSSSYFSEVEYSTAVNGLPHSKQFAFKRDVINPQDGHILCDPYPATCGFTLRIQWSNRIVKRTINRPKEILVAFIKATLLR